MGRQPGHGVRLREKELIHFNERRKQWHNQVDLSSCSVILLEGVHNVAIVGIGRHRLDLAVGLLDLSACLHQPVRALCSFPFPHATC